MTASCTCTVAICTRDRSDALRCVLGDVLAQAPADARVVVVDQSGPDGMSANAAWIASCADPRIQLIALDHGGLPAARNAAIAAAAGRVLIFFDDDARLHPGCVDAHLRVYEDRTVGAVVGRIVERVVAPNAPPGTCRIDAGGRARCNLDGGVAGEVGSLKGANMSFRRLALAGVGGFDEGFSGTAFLEEADVAAGLREAGWRLWHEPRAGIDHLSLPTGGCRASDPMQAEAARFFNTGRWVAKHRPWSRAAVWVTFALIAARRSNEWGEPRAATELLRALSNGLRSR